ncbi:MAG: azurin [Pseudoxanthomonas sp.]
MKHARSTAVLVLLAALFLAPGAWARTCALSIAGNDQMKFDKSTLVVAADCSEVALTLTHSGKLAANVMGHNWVLSKTADFQAVATAGMKATLAQSYLPAGDARVIAHTDVIGGGKSTTVTFPVNKLKKGEAYTFFCSFPGHWALMKGTLTFG